jgi:sporulation related protein
MRLRAVLSVVLLGCAVPAPGVAQELGRVEDLALSGQAEEARAALTTWWGENFDEATRLDRQKGLWLRGLLTVDPELAELDFQRLVVEYPGGPFTAEALVRLGGAAEARGELGEAQGYFTTLLRDYPGSRYQALARAWLDSRVARRGAASIPHDSASVTQPPPSAAEAPRPTRRFAVQLGAFSSEARALTLLKGVTGAGFTARVVQVEGNGLFRVRIGHYSTEEEAKAEMARVVALGFEATVVRNANREGR